MHYAAYLLQITCRANLVNLSMPNAYTSHCHLLYLARYDNATAIVQNDRSSFDISSVVQALTDLPRLLFSSNCVDIEH